MAILTTRESVLFCDKCTFYPDNPEIEPTTKPSRIRAIAKKQGWVRRVVDNRTLDLCPDCQKKLTSPT